MRHRYQSTLFDRLDGVRTLVLHGVLWVFDEQGRDLGNYVYRTNLHRIGDERPANSLTAEQVVEACAELARKRRERRT